MDQQNCGRQGAKFGNQVRVRGLSLRPRRRWLQSSRGGSMDKKIAGLLGAAAALTVVNSAQAAAPATSAIEPAASYRDLLEPVPNALALLKNDDTQGTELRTDGQTGSLSITTIIIIAIIGVSPSPSSPPLLSPQLLRSRILQLRTWRDRRVLAVVMLFVSVLLFFRFGLCRTEKMAVGAIEDRIGTR